MRISQEEFFGILGTGGMYSHLRDSLLPFEPGTEPEDRELLITNLFDDVVTGRYFPSPPRGHIVYDKHNRVARIVPVFTVRDSMIYYFCVMRLQDYLAVNRVNGTFGGWRLSNAIRTQEETERDLIDVPVTAEDDEEVATDVLGYPIGGSLSPADWLRHYKDFQGLAYAWSRRTELSYFLEFDIANFYDTINLDVLERKIRSTVSHNLSEVVDLLFVLLRFWNRSFEGYGAKSVGIPQDDVGDCSRILANFYLQDYDEFMRELCFGFADDGRYLRYADDQIIMTQGKRNALSILFQASIELHKIGVNINASKVHEFNSKVEFDHYWAFTLFDLLRDPEDSESINAAARQFVELVADPRPCRLSSVLLRLISVGLERLSDENRREILRTVRLSKDLPKFDARTLIRIHAACDDDERTDFNDFLDTWSEEVHHNSFHLNLRRYYAKCRPGEPIDHLDRRINELGSL